MRHLAICFNIDFQAIEAFSFKDIFHVYWDSNPLFFSLLPWVAQTALTEEFMFQNAAYRPTVYRTGTFKKLSKFYGSYGRIIVLSMSNDLQMYTQNAMIW